MSRKQTQARQDAQFRILKRIHENPDVTQRQLAEEVGISVGGLHYLLRALIDKGLVKLANFTVAEDKRRYAYVLTPKGISEKTRITRQFLRRKMDEYAALKAEIDALRHDLELGSTADTAPTTDSR